MKHLRWIRSAAPYDDVIGDCIICISHKPSNRGYPRITRYGRMGHISRLVMNRRCGSEQPSSIEARHTCDNKLCINPDHIIPGTHSDNLRDSFIRQLPARGEKAGQSKLKDSDIPKIRKLLSRGISQNNVEKQFGVSGRTISALKLGKTWRHIP